MVSSSSSSSTVPKFLDKKLETAIFTKSENEAKSPSSTRSVISLCK